MAKLQKFRDYHYDATSKVSDNTRTLALAAIAIVWLFKTKSGEHFLVPKDLQWPLILVITALALDFFQHFYRSIVWHVIFRRREDDLADNIITEDDDLYASPWVNFPAYVFYYLKVVALTFSYVLLIAYLFEAVGWV